MTYKEHRRSIALFTAEKARQERIERQKEIEAAYQESRNLRGDSEPEPVPVPVRVRRQK